MKTKPSKSLLRIVKKRKNPLHHRYKPSTKSQPFRHSRSQQPARPLKTKKRDPLVSSYVFQKDMLASLSSLAGLPVQEACEQFVESRRGHLAPQSIDDYLVCCKHIGITLYRICEQRGLDYRKLKIDHMDATWLRFYQKDRGAIDQCNKECTIIRQTYFRAFEKRIVDYQRLPKPREYEAPGRQLGEDERKLWKKTCIENSDNPATDIAALSSLVTVCSGMGYGEIRRLKLKDIHMMGEHNALGLPEQPFVIVPKRAAKRKRRERKVMLFDEAVWAMAKLIDRAKNKCGSTAPDHFLLPYRNYDRTYDVNRPCGRSCFAGLRQLHAIAGTKFRYYDQRHDAISRALSDRRVPLVGATAHFGHFAPKMVDTYFHGNDDVLTTVAKAINQIPDEAPAMKKPAVKVRTSVRLTQTCPECLGKIPKAARRCQHCGQPVEKSATG